MSGYCQQDTVLYLLTENTALKEQLTTLQSKADALADALETVKRYLSVGNATSAYNYIFIALATYKESKQ